MQKLRVAVVGCGRIASVYREAFHRLSDRIELVLAVDKELARAEAFAADFPGAQASDARDEEAVAALLKECRADVLHILLPHFLHARYAIAALSAGVHVLTEKPVAISLSDADRMIAAEKQSGKQLGVIFQNRYIEGVQRVRELIKSGALGEVKGAFSTLNWFRPPSYYACDWKGSWEKEGGGVVIDQAIHSIDLVRYMTGLEAVSVQGHTARRVLTNIEVEDEADAAIRLSNGAIYSFFACNYYTNNSPIRVEISCENGTALLTLEHMQISFKDGRKEEISAVAYHSGGESYWGVSHIKQLDDFYAALLEGRKVPWTPEDARNTLEIVQAIYLSSRIQSEVALHPIKLNAS